MMKTKKCSLSICVFSLIGLLLFVFLSACQPETAPKTVIQQPKLVITPEKMNPIEQKIAEAFENAITGREDVLSFLIYDVNIDNIQLNSNKNRALIWLSLSDPETGDLVPAEAGLAIAVKQKAKKTENPWKITLQADANWEKVLNSLPKKLIDDETKERFSNRQQSIPHAAKVYTGYRLPWATGESKRLSGSIGHVYLYKSCPTTCLYAFDFYDGTMWPILAAKGGRVKYAVWNYPNGNSKHANFIVLEDTTTNPTTYQVYMHLAQNSIPEALRTPGARVVQGQQIGVVDDTGYSTGHHLHFHVHTNPNSYWGSSVDIVFDEVKVNGGRPRTCNESNLFPALGKSCQTGNLYMSQNNDYANPKATINSVTIKDQIVDIKGKATDDSGIQSLQVVINYDGSWIIAKDVPVSDIKKKGNFTTTFDLCELQVPDGDFQIALSVTDKAYKTANGTPGLQTVTKQYECPLPPPKCTASSAQVALFEKPEFQGECVLLDPGSYEPTGDVLAQITALGSIQVGADVISQFSTQSGQSAVTADLLDAAALDIDFKDIQKVTVEARPPVPQQQTISISDQTAGTDLSSASPIIVSWEILHESFEYRVILTQKGKQIAQQDWSKTGQWELAALEAGTYTLTLETHNPVGDAISSIDFIVQEPDLAPVTSLVDLPETIDSATLTINWTVQKGVEDLQYVEIRYSENGQDWVVLGTFPAQVASTTFYGNPGSVYQFEIRGIDLAGNAEEFHGGTFSKVNFGTSCTPDEYELIGQGDDTLETASPLKLDSSQEHNICELGDHDYFSFSAEKGALYRITASPMSPSGSFRLKLFDLLSTESVAEAVTEGNENLEILAWTAPESATYYVDVSASNPESYGNQTAYKINVKKSVQLTSPQVLVPTLLIPVLWSLLAAGKKFLLIIKK